MGPVSTEHKWLNSWAQKSGGQWHKVLLDSRESCHTPLINTGCIV